MVKFPSTHKCILAGILSLFFQNSGWAANTQSTLLLGLSFFNQTSAGLVSQMGYNLGFLVENRDNWIRPTYGGTIEASFGTNRLIDGQMSGGVEVVAASALIAKPYLGASGLFGWGSLATSSATYVGVVYGFQLSAGTEIRFTEKEKANSLRIASQWRYLLGDIGGGLMGADLMTLSVLLGMTF